MTCAVYFSRDLAASSGSQDEEALAKKLCMCSKGVSIGGLERWRQRAEELLHTRSGGRSSACRLSFEAVSLAATCSMNALTGLGKNYNKPPSTTVTS